MGITRWQVRNALNKIIQPISIIKQRTVNGTPSFTLNWTWVNSKPNLAPEFFETCEPTIYLSELCQELIDEFEAKKKKPKKVKKKPAVVKTQPPENEKITQFFKEKKKPPNPVKSIEVKSEKTKDVLTEKSQNVFTEKPQKITTEKPLKKPINKHLNIVSQKPLSIPTKKPLNMSNQDFSMMSEDETLPDNLSLLVEDILSQRIKRNLSIEQPTELVTSTPVNQGSRFKKLITPSKVSNYPKLPIGNLVENMDSDQENLLLIPPKTTSTKSKIQDGNPTKSKIQESNPTKFKFQHVNPKLPRLPNDNLVENIDSNKNMLLPFR